MSQIQHTCHDRLASQMVKHVHQSVAKESLEFLSALRRYNYVTPTSYLEVLSTYRNVLTMKRLEVGTLKNRLQVILRTTSFQGLGLFPCFTVDGRTSKLPSMVLSNVTDKQTSRVNRFPQLCTSPVSAPQICSVTWTQKGVQDHPNAGAVPFPNVCCCVGVRWVSTRSSRRRSRSVDCRNNSRPWSQCSSRLKLRWK